VRALAVSLVALLTGSCGEEEQPPFQFVIHHDATVLMEEHFANYEAALASGPYVVEVGDGTTTDTLSLEIGFCRGVTCLGPVTHESLAVTLLPPGAMVHTWECLGLDGSFRGLGIDGAVLGGDCVP
jgi:hypothetical protein